MTKSQKRYEGIQTLLGKCSSDGCFFLCLLTIAEDVTGDTCDLINIIHLCLERGWIDDTFYVKDSLSILSYLTGKEWKRRKVDSLPPIGINDYSVVIYHNNRTGYNHYRRRPYDTLESSVTVREGYIWGYYIYSWR